MELIIDLLNGSRWAWMAVAILVSAATVARWIAADIRETVHELFD